MDYTSKRNKQHKEWFADIRYLSTIKGYGLSINCECGRIMQPPKNMGYIYLAKAEDGLYKFGKTSSLGRRKAQHKATHPDFEYLYSWYIDNYDFYERRLNEEIRQIHNADRHSFMESAYLIEKGIVDGVATNFARLTEYFTLKENTIEEIAQTIEAELRGQMTSYYDIYHYSTYVYWTKKTEAYFDPKDHRDKYEEDVHEVVTGSITKEEMKQKQKEKNKELKVLDYLLKKKIIESHA